MKYDNIRPINQAITAKIKFVTDQIETPAEREAREVSEAPIEQWTREAEDRHKARRKLRLLDQATGATLDWLNKKPRR